MSKLLEQINNTRLIKKLGDLVLINQSTITSKFPYKEIEYIDTASVTRNHFDRPQILNIDKAPSRAKRLLKDGDTILSTVRPSLCHYGFIKNPKPNTVVSTGFVVLTPKNIDPFYLYSYLTQDSITNTLSSIAEATTTTFPAFRPEFLSGMEIEIPDLPTQKKIAEILSAYDAKIENNNKIIKNLEATAQTIFNEWFVKFRFPGYKKVKMVESEIGEIPEGWEVGKIVDLTTIMNSGGTPSTINKDYYSGNISWFSTKELQDSFLFDSEKKITKEGLNNSSAKIFLEKTVVMAIYAAPTVGRLGILSKDSCFNQAAVGLVAKENVGYEFVYLLLKFLRNDLNNMANGAAQQNLNVGIVKNYKIKIPSNSVLEKFKAVVSPSFILMLSLQKENISLKQSRDQLLAKLV
mgnify:CR=1 FL=1